MPFTVRKGPSGYNIVKQLPGGRSRVVGHSTSRSKAEASIRARNAGAHGGGRRG